MPAYFLDASALVKRYLRETGSDWLRQLLATENPRIFISSLSGPEVLAAITRKGRTGEIAPSEQERAIETFRNEFTSSYAVIAPGPAVIRRAMELIVAHPLRAYDAVQLASVLALPPVPSRIRLTFVAADERLLTVANQIGLPTENPNLYS